VLFDGDIRRALSHKVEASDRSIPVVDPLAEDAEDIKAFQSRVTEPNLNFDNVVQSMRRRGKL
jgi:hypothetical protein